MSSDDRFQHGLVIGGSLAAPLLVFVYAVAAPTHDLRARIPFLAVLPGVVLMLVLGFAIVPIVVLFTTKTVSAKAIAGVAVVSAVMTTAVGEGSVRFLWPDIETPLIGWGLFTFASLLGAWFVYLQTKAFNKHRK